MGLGRTVHGSQALKSLFGEYTASKNTCMCLFMICTLFIISSHFQQKHFRCYTGLEIRTTG